jgi:hypothetical protein
LISSPWQLATAHPVSAASTTEHAAKTTASEMSINILFTTFLLRGVTQNKKGSVAAAFLVVSCLGLLRTLTLRELRTLTRFVTSVFLSLNRTGVTGQETLFLQDRAELWLNGLERSGDTVAHRTNLSRESSTGNGDLKAVLAEPLSDL